MLLLLSFNNAITTATQQLSQLLLTSTIAFHHFLVCSQTLRQFPLLVFSFEMLNLLGAVVQSRDVEDMRTCSGVNGRDDG